MSATPESRRTGWLGFAVVLLLVDGIFNLLQALAAFFTPAGYYNVSRAGLFLMSLNGYGWWNLIVGLLLISTAGGVFAGYGWARSIAVVLATLSAVEQLFLVPAQPWWALVVIAIDVLIIYAVIVHGREVPD
jgi:hypothetical protein